VANLYVTNGQTMKTVRLLVLLLLVFALSFFLDAQSGAQTQPAADLIVRALELEHEE